METIVSFFSSVPDVIWSGLLASVVASTITLGGVLLSNRGNSQRLKLQLDHDAREKAKERITSLRRDVYIQTAEELSKLSNYLTSLPQADLAKTNTAEGFQGFVTAATKLQLVAEPQTALLVNELLASYSDLFFRLLNKLVPLQELRVAINLRNSFYDKAQNEATRIIGEMNALNETGQKNETVFRALNTSFEFQQAQATKLAEERDVFWTRHNKMHVEFQKALLVELRAIGERQIDVMIEIRRDLGLTTELDAFRKQMEEHWKQMRAGLDRLIERLNGGSSSDSDD